VNSILEQTVQSDSTLETGDCGEILSIWQRNPYEGVSWWDMLQFAARQFTWVIQGLENVKLDCYMASIPGDGDEPIFNMMTQIDDRLKDKAERVLVEAEAQCRAIDLSITADAIGDIRKGIETDARVTRNCQWLLDQVRGVQKLIERETKGRVFLYCPPERSKFLPNVDLPYVFGEPVAEAFPSAMYDIHEAAMCLGLARSSASVFHLMRTLEVGLAALGDKFGVSLEHTNWAPAIDQIESKIREMHKDPIWKVQPDCKTLQEKYAQAASLFGVFKDAWRNHTMHRRGKYTEGEAEMIFNNVKSFMAKLADMGLEEKEVIA
jgi:hypothetical protein